MATMTTHRPEQMERQETPGQGDTPFKCHLVNTTLQDLGSVWHKTGQGKDWEINIALSPRQSSNAAGLSSHRPKDDTILSPRQSAGAVGLSSHRLHQGEQGLLSCGFIFSRKPTTQECPLSRRPPHPNIPEPSCDM